MLGTDTLNELGHNYLISQSVTTRHSSLFVDGVEPSCLVLAFRLVLWIQTSHLGDWSSYRDALYVPDNCLDITAYTSIIIYENLFIGALNSKLQHDSLCQSTMMVLARTFALG